MLEKCIYLITVKVDKLAALLTFHVIALSLAAVLRAYKFIASRRFLIDDVLIYQSVSRKAVQTSVYRGLADVYSLFSEITSCSAFVNFFSRINIIKSAGRFYYYSV